MVLVQYGTVDAVTVQRRAARGGKLMLAIFSVGIIAFVAVLMITRSSSVSELQEVSAKEALQDMDHYFDKQQKTIKQSLRSLPYRSASEARRDLNQYFNKDAAKRPSDYISSDAAMKELDYIFPSGKKSSGSSEKEILAFSQDEAKNDLDNYFDNMDTATHSHAWGDMDSSSKKYIENKRKALSNSHGGFTTVDANGNTVDTKKIWSAAAAAADMDSYYGSNHLPAAHSSSAIAAKQEEALKIAKAKKLEEAIKSDPALKKKLDQVHQDWLKKHGALPSTAQDKAAYAKLVKAAVGKLDLTVKPADLQAAAATATAKAAATATPEQPKKLNIKRQYEVFNAYLDLHPQAAAKFDEFKAVWRQNHSHDHPKTAEEAKEYKTLMAKYVGHLDINAEEVAKQWEVKQRSKKSAKKTAESQELASSDHKAAKEEASTEPAEKQKLRKVRAEWNAKHGFKMPTTPSEQAEYRSMLIKAGLVTSKKLAPTISSLAAKQHTPEEIEKAKQRALVDLMKHQGDVKAKLDKVHHIWMNKHSAPPQNPAEEKEYDALMDQYVGHPDISMQLQRGGAKPDAAAPAPAAAAAAGGKQGDDDNMLDLDASILG